MDFSSPGVQMVTSSGDCYLAHDEKLRDYCLEKVFELYDSMHDKKTKTLSSAPKNEAGEQIAERLEKYGITSKGLILGIVAIVGTIVVAKKFIKFVKKLKTRDFAKKKQNSPNEEGFYLFAKLKNSLTHFPNYVKI